MGSKQRKYIEVTPDLLEEFSLICFLMKKNRKDFATQILKEALKPYHHWVEGIKKLKYEVD